jgi:hypothetical protein
MTENTISIKGNIYYKNVNAFYIINGEQSPDYFHSGKWYSTSGGKLIYDNARNKWLLKSYRDWNLTLGIVGYDTNEEKFLMGYFSISPGNTINCLVSNSNVTVRNRTPIALGSLKEIHILAALSNFAFKCDKLKLKVGMYKFGLAIDNSLLLNMTSDDLHSLKQYDNAMSYEFINDYGFRYSLADHYSVGSICTSVSKVNFDSDLDHLYDLIKPFSYGFEIETTAGKMPDYRIWKNGFVPLKDGSISGYEFTSIPFHDATGMNSLRDLQDQLSSFSIDKYCSLHIHIGNTKMTNKELVAFYMLTYQIQQEVIDFLPPYKRSENYFAEKAGQSQYATVKDHCKPFRSLGFYIQDSSIEEKYETLCDFVNPYDVNPDYNDEDYDEDYEQQPQELSKWNEYSRYFGVNLLPYIKNGSTIEFRSHEPTLNFQKIINWLLIISATVKYTKANTDYILNKNKITLSNVIDVYSNSSFEKKVSTYLKEYIKERTITFMDHHIKGMYNSDSFLHNDKTYSFQQETFKEILTNKWQQEKQMESETEPKEIITKDNWQ